MLSCHFSVGNWLVASVEHTPWRSSRIFQQVTAVLCGQFDKTPVIEDSGHAFSPGVVRSLG